MNGGMKILKNCGNDFENKVYNDLSFFYKELETFTGERKSGSQGHDDLVDVCSDGFIVLAQKLSIPLFTLPSMTKSNEFSF
jgi:hypothetical protein